MNPSNVSPPSNSPDFGSSASASDTAKQKAQELKASATATAQDLKHKVSETASHLKDEAAHMADDRKRDVADRIKGYSSAIHDTAKNFEQDDPNIAWFTHQAADRLQSVADYVRQRNFHELKLDAERVARQHPGVLIGGTFVTGLLIGSILRAGGSAIKESTQQPAGNDYRYDPVGTAGTSGATGGTYPSATSPAYPTTPSYPTTPGASTGQEI
jgi:ElaB/YqjD/DUF883 family membrane-anchored ribosome-binding protein